jgi:DNA-binding beta-propeller fold protein YncE
MVSRRSSVEKCRLASDLDIARHRTVSQPGDFLRVRSGIALAVPGVRLNGERRTKTLGAKEASAMRQRERATDLALGYLGLALIGVLGWAADCLGGARATAPRSADSTGQRRERREGRRMTHDARGRTSGTIAARLAAAVTAVTLTLTGSVAFGEILGLVNYETKSAESLKTLKRPIAPPARKEGLAVVDLEPGSKTFGRVVKDIELPGDTVAHHISYNRDQSKAYITALGRPELRVIEMADPNLSVKVVAIPDCQVGEDVVFSEDNRTWYVTCMGSDALIVGDAVTDKPLRTIRLPLKYPHGIAIHNGIDRILTTSTVRASDLGDPGEAVGIIEASTGRWLGELKVSTKPSPAKAAPVEILFVPGSNPPVAYVTNMYEGTLAALTWNPGTKSFTFSQAFDFGPMKMGVPLEMYFTDDGRTMYVTTAKPGHLHVFDLSKHPAAPVHKKAIAAAEGAHHVAFTRDWKWAFVQNSLLNLPGMSDGSITVVDLQQGDVVASVETLKESGYNPNSIVLLPKWNHLAGH